jgi:CheY-like chemotaxis protein
MSSHAIPYIAIVDDNPDDATLLRLQLGEGYRIRVYHGAIAALAAFRNVAPSLVLCDLLMPGYDGPTLLAAMRNVPGCESVPVIAVSALLRDGMVSRLQELGFAGMLWKPVDEEALRLAVRSVLGPRPSTP